MIRQEAVEPVIFSILSEDVTASDIDAVERLISGYSSATF